MASANKKGDLQWSLVSSRRLSGATSDARRWGAGGGPVYVTCNHDDDDDDMMMMMIMIMIMMIMKSFFQNG